MAYSIIRDEVGDFDVESNNEMENITTEGRYTVHLHAPMNNRMPSD